jgi:hypothetical protein
MPFGITCRIQVIKNQYHYKTLKTSQNGNNDKKGFER